MSVVIADKRKKSRIPPEQEDSVIIAVKRKKSRIPREAGGQCHHRSEAGECREYHPRVARSMPL